MKQLDRAQPVGTLILRIALALSMTVHGYQKVFHAGAVQHFAAYVATLGIPAWLGYVSAWTEFLGGILILFGLLTRVASALVAINMLVALLAVGIQQGFGIYNYIFALLAIAVALVFQGAGPISVDRRLGIG
ncbi:DoxX family protein [Terriglobus tenax]|uniref:DoxX family protein n=1 Tax=Terriglobus tenax TaxID=1111115 RepID=UPI0021E0CE3F|nr:DoxX family protein [Terriglobus tenax]